MENIAIQMDMNMKEWQNRIHIILPMNNMNR